MIEDDYPELSEHQWARLVSAALRDLAAAVDAAQRDISLTLRSLEDPARDINAEPVSAAQLQLQLERIVKARWTMDEDDL